MDSIYVSEFCLTQNNYLIQIIEFFNAYREFLFDNQTFIGNITSNLYLHQFKKQLGNNVKYLNSNNKKYYTSNELQENKTLCGYYINDFFDSSGECEELVGLISTYNFKIFTFNFIEKLKISKNIVKYKLENEKIFGNLTEYNYSDYINNELIPYLDDSDNGVIFRLDLFNNDTLHYNLNIKFFSIILPYIQENRQRIYNI